MWNSHISATNLIDTAVKAIGARPRSRRRQRDRGRGAAVQAPQDALPGADAVWELRDPDGLASDILVEAQANPVEPRMVGRVADRLQALSESICGQTGAPSCLLVSPYLSPLTRERLTEAGIGYADATGNIRFAVDRPAVYIETQGADRNPFREDRPRRPRGQGSPGLPASLRNPGAGRRDQKLGGHGFAGVQPAGAGRDRRQGEPRGRIVRVDWEALAHRWAMDYDFATSNVPTTWLEPRGTGALFARLRDTGIRYAVTGSFAGHRLAPIAEPRLAALYVDDPDTAARSLGRGPAETGGNVLLVRPFDPVAFERAEHDDGIAFARATQVLPDLMTGPGRGPAEAKALLAWMRDHEDLWQLPLTETT